MLLTKKTAALFEAACRTAAVLSEATQPQQAAASKFGSHLGIAFQLVDDALDYEGDAEALGKNIGDDLAEGKPTLPLIYAMQYASEVDSQTIRTAITQGDTNQLNAIVTIVKKCGALAYTMECARQHVKEAQDCLRQLPENRYRTAMAALADFAVSRNY